MSQRPRKSNNRRSREKHKNQLFFFSLNVRLRETKRWRLQAVELSGSSTSVTGELALDEKRRKERWVGCAREGEVQLKPNWEETWKLRSFRDFGEKRVEKGLEWDDEDGDDTIPVLLAVAEGDANAISVLGFRCCFLLLILRRAERWAEGEREAGEGEGDGRVKWEERNSSHWVETEASENGGIFYIIFFLARGIFYIIEAGIFHLKSKF